VRCPSCDFENPSGLKFCGDCGEHRPGDCPACGCDNPPGFKFCGECGQALSEGERRLEPRSYTPKYLADKILQSRSALEGERKQVTVLFADLKGSMDLQEKLGPEEWHRIMDRFFQILSEGVHRFEGTVNQCTAPAGRGGGADDPTNRAAGGQPFCHVQRPAHYEMVRSPRKINWLRSRGGGLR
jgi:hypothetical protein